MHVVFSFYVIVLYNYYCSPVCLFCLFILFVKCYCIYYDSKIIACVGAARSINAILLPTELYFPCGGNYNTVVIS